VKLQASKEVQLAKGQPIQLKGMTKVPVSKSEKKRELRHREIALWPFRIASKWTGEETR